MSKGLGAAHPALRRGLQLRRQLQLPRPPRQLYRCPLSGYGFSRLRIGLSALPTSREVSGASSGTVDRVFLRCWRPLLPPFSGPACLETWRQTGPCRPALLCDGASSLASNLLNANNHSIHRRAFTALGKRAAATPAGTAHAAVRLLPPTRHRRPLASFAAHQGAVVLPLVRHLQLGLLRGLLRAGSTTRRPQRPS
jgi:hypothetical protein